MALDDRNKLNRLEELKTKLFSKNYKTQIDHRDGFSHLHTTEVVDSWADTGKTDPDLEGRFFMKTSMFKKFFIFSLCFFLMALAYGSYVFFAGGNTVSNTNIDISITGNNFTAGGEELPLIVSIANKNISSLDLVDLVMQYPKGTSDNTTGDTENFRESLGSIPAGSVRNENLKVTLFGEQGVVVPIKISIEYRVAGSNAIFVKDTTYQVTISSTPINLSVDAPTTISSNQDIVLNVKEILNATKPASNILMKVNYPAGFVFSKAVPAPSFGNNVWSLGDLAPGAEHDIAISGKMVDVFEGEEKTFNVSTGSQSTSDKSMLDVIFNSIGHTITIQKPFIQANLFINGVSQTEYASDSKTPIHGEIRFTNNLDTKVENLVVVAKVSGSALDRKTIFSQQGFYNSADDTIKWDKTSVDQLKEVNPGDSGSLDFSLSPLALYSANGGMMNDPAINIEVDISGSQAVQGFATNTLANSTSAIIRITSDVGFSSKAFYYSGPFTNTGPIPPKVQKTTTYTVTWSLSSTANSISKAQVSSSLPPWVDFVGSLSPSDEDLVYNSSTKQIVWNANRIQKGAGITGPARMVSFQVSISPSLSQVAQTPTILNDTVLTGHDDFANVDIRVAKLGLTTKLDSDPALPANGGVVVP